MDRADFGGRWRANRCLAAFHIVFAAACLAGGPLQAADFGAECCADLEQRVAELEQTVARAGNRKIEVTLSGAVSTAILGWDDGAGLDGAIVTNDGEGTKLEFTGEHDGIGDGGSWSAGVKIEIGLIRAGSGAIDQTDFAGPDEIEIAEGHVWVRHQQLGQVSLGQVGGGDASENATEADLSGTALASYAGIEDLGGGFFLRNASAGGLTPVTWGDLIDHMPGIDGNVVRYDTPRLGGFLLTAEWGEDDVWEVALGYTNVMEDAEAGEDESPEQDPPAAGNPFDISGVISYHEVLEDDDDLQHGTISGSLSVVHKQSGFNLTYAGGWRRFVELAEFTDGSLDKRDPASFHYLKAGWLAGLGLGGDTAFYGEWGRFADLLGGDADEEAVAALGGIALDGVCSGAGAACLVSDSRATIWGLGVVQHIDAADTQLYLGYRNHRAEIGLADAKGAGLGAAPTEDFDTIIAGALINF